jgi:UPF0755 protein
VTRGRVWAATLLAALSICGLGIGMAANRIQRILATPYQAYSTPSASVEIAAGTPAARILENLERAGVLRSARWSGLELRWRLGSPPLQAGEYVFDAPLTSRQVLELVARGAVALHPVTIVEGWTLEETAAHLALKGFGGEAALLAAMRDPAPIHDLDPQATTLEGYLFPDTYSFAKGTTERQIVLAMVGAFRSRLDTALNPAQPWPAEISRLRQLVTLASLVEKEAQAASERPLIAGVYLRRLRIGMLLQADPTVIYAKKLRGAWDGNLRRADLSMADPYNTYRFPGLPPGPICSPGLASLVAASRPRDEGALYFVSRNDGTHVFAATLGEHNENVAEWQKRYWRRPWGAKRGAAGPPA